MCTHAHVHSHQPGSVGTGPNKQQNLKPGIFLCFSLPPLKEAKTELAQGQNTQEGENVRIPIRAHQP